MEIPAKPPWSTWPTEEPLGWQIVCTEARKVGLCDPSDVPNEEEEKPKKVGASSYPMVYLERICEGDEVK